MREPKERWYSYVRGWTHGASARAMDPLFTELPKDDSARVEYEQGYSDARRARAAAADGAAKRLGYTPSVLRAPPTPAVPEGGERP